MISLVAAVDDEGIIGDSQKEGLLWRCMPDLELFRRLTIGNWVVVGRKTWESLPASAQKHRKWIILTSEAPEHGMDISERPYRTGSWDALVDWASIRSVFDDHIVIAGGGSVYRQALATEDLVNRVFLTRIPLQTGGDIEFPILEGWTRDRERYIETTIASDFDQLEAGITVEEYIHD